jgi:hypothetical protein
VAVTEDQDVGRRKPRPAPGLASLGVTGLVDHCEANALDLDVCDFGKALPQLAVVVVSVHANESAGLGLQLVEQVNVHPVAGVHDHVGHADPVPDLGGKVLGSLGQMCVRDEEEASCHDLLGGISLADLLGVAVQPRVVA